MNLDKEQKEEHLDYLFKSLQHHPSPYLIYDLEGNIKWANLAAEFIFRIEKLTELSIIKLDLASIQSSNSTDPIARSYTTPIEVRLRKIEFFIRTRVHVIPVSHSDNFLLIEILCNSRSGLEAIQQTISCIEFDRIDLAYQKQFNIKTGEVTGVEALLRMRDEFGQIIPNDLIIPQIEGESLFSLIVLSSLEKLSEFFKIKDKLGLKDATVYLNVSAHTVMHPQFGDIFTNYADSMGFKQDEFGLEVTETAELSNTEEAAKSLQKLKNKGIKIALDDFGAGYSSLRYIKDLPVDVVKLDKHFTNGLDDPTTSKLIGFVVEVCKALSLEMIGEGIETEEQKQTMLKIGCEIGQGYLMHRPEFIESMLAKDG
tara:strand:- start:1107 stop:2216 length:1110 start_codon:yes stop_codon:yes gene_type:complete